MKKNKYIYIALFLIISYLIFLLYSNIKKTNDFKTDFDKNKSVFKNEAFIFNQSLKYKSKVYCSLFTTKEGDALIVYKLKGKVNELNFIKDDNIDESGGFKGFTLAGGYCMNSSDFLPEFNTINLHTSFFLRNEFSNILIHRIYSSKTKIILNQDSNQSIIISANNEEDKLYIELFTYKKNNFTYLFLINPKKNFEFYNSNKLLSHDIIEMNIKESLF